MPPVVRARMLSVGALLAVTAVARAAVALDEADWQVALTPTAALFVTTEDADGGLGGRLEGRYGVTDALSAWGAGGSAWQFLEGGGSARVGTLSAGMTLAFDVLRTVPFVELGLTFMDVGGAPPSSRHLGGELAAGAEYLVDRRWSVALVGRAQFCPLLLSGSRPGLLRFGVLSAGLRLGYAF